MKTKDFCWAAHRNTSSNEITILGPFEKWTEAKEKRNQLKADMMSIPDTQFSNPFWAPSIEQAKKEIKKIHLWPYP